MSSRAIRPGATGAFALAVAAAGLLAAPASGVARAEVRIGAPRITQMVVFRDGHSVTRAVRSAPTHVRVERRHCAVGAGTPLAALVRSRVGRLRLLDFGSCSPRARDGGGLFVSGIAGERNRGQNGWAYKVGRRAATAGAADPGGPFGRGRLRPGQRVTWFWCVLGTGGCQRTLALRARPEPGALVVSVRSYDDEGEAEPAEGASVSVGDVQAITGANGSARLTVPAGSYRVVARKRGLVRSFAEPVVVP